MLVLVFSTEYPPHIVGGLGVVATRLFDRLAHLGVEQVMVTQGDGRGCGPGAGGSLGTRCGATRSRVIRIPTNPAFYDGAYRSFRPTETHTMLVARGVSAPSVLHLHSVAFAATALYLRALTATPVIYTCHSLVMDEPPSSIRDRVAEHQEALIREADRVVVPSQWLASRLQSRYAVAPDRIRVVPNGVEIPSPRPVPAGPRDAALLYVGRVVPGKGLEELIDALGHLDPTHGAYLDVLGHGDPAYRTRLEARVRALQGLAQVHWLGFLEPDRIPEVYDRYRAIIVPSYQESFGLVALEALAAGVPLVATQAGGLEEFLSDRVAWLVRPRDSTAIARAVEEILSDPGEARARSDAGRLLAVQYDQAKVAAAYRALFDDVVGYA